jgi:DinB family protein
MTPEALSVRLALNSWKQAIGQIDKTLAALSDEELQREVAPGRNRLYYLLGHLTAVHDRLFPLLRLGERMHAELDEAFLVQPDRASPDRVPAADLRTAWSEVNGKLTAAFESLRPEEWLERHDSISPEDFVKEPLRNRLAVLLSRTNHASSHEGQMRLAAPRAAA